MKICFTKRILEVMIILIALGFLYLMKVFIGFEMAVFFGISLIIKEILCKDLDEIFN